MSEMEDEFERHLSEQMRRVEAPTSLADAIVKRAAREPRSMAELYRHYPHIWRMAALLLLTALLCGAGVADIYHRRAVERARAEHDFARSLELTSRALEPVRRHLRRAGIALDQ